MPRSRLTDRLLAVLAVALLAALGTVAAAADRDLDGVPDERDSCPNLPNEPGPSGAQAAICGAGFREAIRRHVFLDSRTLVPRDGIDPALTADGGVRRVMLHIRRDDDRIVLTTAQRAQLQAAGVKLWDYLPRYTYLATVPAIRQGLAAIARLPFIQGMSALEPRDRISHSLRRTQGGPAARQPDGGLLLAVELFPDVTREQAAVLFREVGVRPVSVDEEERLVLARDFADVLALARSDLVHSIDEAPRELRQMDDRALAETSAAIVDRVQGFEGEGLKVAMLESLALPLPPDQHPDLSRRVVRGNTGALGIAEGTGHALKVAGVMIGSGRLDPTKRGFLPEAVLIDFADVLPRTAWRRGFHYPRRAREDHGAVVFNYSNGISNCNKVGEYRAYGRQIDKSVHITGISVVRAVGNGRGPNGELNSPDVPGGPRAPNLESLQAPVPKNDIAVGNWNLNFDDVDEQSGVGPAADERLKPDLVAPGNGLTSTSFDPKKQAYGYARFDGTSAAAPAVSGVVGQVYQAFRDGAASRDLLAVPPASVKAILIHTARDVGPWGPDYFTGWGRVDAAAAVNVALNHGTYLHESEVTEDDPEDAYDFDVTGNIYGFKVTLVWDDPHVSGLASKTLKNDLDLVVTDPTGAQQFFPLDTLLTTSDRLAEAEQGAKRCTSASCQDRVNNVEQVLVTAGGGPLATGTWTATVAATDLADPSQKFSLVVTPDECPVRIYEMTTLAGPVSCPAHNPLLPMAISIESDDAVLDCGGNEITGAGNDVDGFRGEYAGVRTRRDRVTVRNCVVQDFDVGVDFVANAEGRIESTTVRRVGTAGVRVSGERHTITEADVSAVRKQGGDAIHASGDSHSVLRSTIVPNPSAPPRAAGIHIEGSSGGDARVANNHVSFATTGILIDSDVQPFIDRYHVVGNRIGPVTEDRILVVGPIKNSAISANEIEGLGTDSAAIKLAAKAQDGGAPSTNVVSFNRITGNGLPTQTGISLAGATWLDASGAETVERPASHQVFGHLSLEQVGIGIDERMGFLNEVRGNLVRASVIGIRSSGSSGNLSGRHIASNIITGAGLGISLDGPSTNDAEANVISDAKTGISVRQTSVGSTSLTTNAIRILRDGVGVVVSAGNSVEIAGNTIQAADAAAPVGVGISASDSGALTITGNTINDLSTGIAVSRTPGAALTGNSIANASTVGIRVASDGISVSGNSFDVVPATAIHYVAGSDGLISGNGLSLAPASAGAHAILLGSPPESAQPTGTVSRVRITSQTVENFANAVTIGRGVTSLTIEGSTLSASSRAIDGEKADELVPAEVTITGTTLTGDVMDAVFNQPVDTSGNGWREVGFMDIFDVDGDGDGDCGADHLFSSTNYAGAQPGVAKTSVLTSQVSDDRPLTGKPGVCP